MHNKSQQTFFMKINIKKLSLQCRIRNHSNCVMETSSIAKYRTLEMKAFKKVEIKIELKLNFNFYFVLHEKKTK